MTHPVHYVIQPIDPAAHLFEIRLTIVQAQLQQVVSLPAWIPGSYMLREFAKHIVTLQVHSDGHALSVQKQDKNTWRIDNIAGATLTIIYQVYAWDLSVRAAHLDDTHGFFNGTSVFLRVHGKEQQSCSLEILPPIGLHYAQWQVATSLSRKSLNVADAGFGLYDAVNYDELVDHPVEMGLLRRWSFTVAGIPHELVINGRIEFDAQRVCDDLQRICEQQIQFWGAAPADLSRYLFLVTVLTEGYGGLEHRASCALLCGRKHLPLVGELAVSENYREFLGLCSHEYFHTWNVKRLKPAAFMPYDFQQENYTRLLWAFEGFTSYYDDLMLLRAGLINDESYLELLARNITRLWRAPGRQVQSVTDSSFDAWTKFYKQDENSPNAIVSYYNKGALVALAIDLSLRQQNKKSLDEVMRCLWQRYGTQMIGVPENGIDEIILEIGGAALSNALNAWLYSTDEIDFSTLLSSVGIAMQRRAAQTLQDQGAYGEANASMNMLPDVGMRIQASEGAWKITHVFNGRAAHVAGLSAGDVIIAWDAWRVDARGVEPILQRSAPGKIVDVHYFRRDELRQTQLTIAAPILDTCNLFIADVADTSLAQHRHVWLHGQ
ncbi:MAG: M61 family metallopeptidase [Gammaproteobacteria bacterium]|nr:M61 family metallopeptidase [Gammaproteobacteria bacterium]